MLYSGRERCVVLTYLVLRVRPSVYLSQAKSAHSASTAKVHGKIARSAAKQSPRSKLVSERGWRTNPH